jgi:hypothetical protein
MTKMKPEGWDQLSRSSKLAAVMWPDLAPKHIQAEMKSISWLEGKTDPQLRAEQARRQQQQAKRR